MCYSINDVEAKYYADGEDAFDMRKNLDPKKMGHGGSLRLPKPTEKPAALAAKPEQGAPERVEGSQDAKEATPGSAPSSEVTPPPLPRNGSSPGGDARPSHRHSQMTRSVQHKAGSVLEQAVAEAPGSPLQWPCVRSLV